MSSTAHNTPLGHAAPPAADLAAALLQYTSAALVQLDENACVQWANPAALALCPALQPAAGQALAALFQPAANLPQPGQPWPDDTALELQLREATADTHWLSVRAQRLPGGTQVLHLHTSQAEQALQSRLAGADPDGLGAQMALSIDLGQIAF